MYDYDSHLLSGERGVFANTKPTQTMGSDDPLACTPPQVCGAEGAQPPHSTTQGGAESDEAGRLFHQYTNEFYDKLEEVGKCSLKAKAESSATTLETAPKPFLQADRGHSAGASSDAAAAAADASAPLGQQRAHIQRLHDVAVAALVAATKEEKAERQRRLAENDREVGRVIPQAMGDMWVDGEEPRALYSRLQEMDRQRREAKEHSKELRKQIDALDAAGGSDKESPPLRRPDAAASGAALNDPRVLLEVNRRRLDLYRRQEAELQQQLSEFNAKKALHIKEGRLVRDELKSPYGKYAIVDHGRYLVLNLLGKGGFSEVWRACDLETCTSVAIKVHQPCSTWSADRKAQYARHARREFEILQRSRHSRVVALLDCFELNQESFCTILEYTPYGDLDSMLKKHRELAEATARPIIAQILSGLAYLHSHRILHYDLKPANVLFFSPSEIKLTDFGLSKLLTGTGPAGGEDTAIELTSQGSGTYWYLPPEVFETRCTPKVTAKVDIWAAGVCFYQMLYGRRPFGHEVSQKQLMARGIIFNAGEVEYPTKPRVSEASRKIISLCLNRLPQGRPSAADLLTDAYFYQNSVGPGAKRMQQKAAAEAAERASDKRPRGGADGGGAKELMAPPPVPVAEADSLDDGDCPQAKRKRR